MNILLWFTILAVLGLISSTVTAVTAYKYKKLSPIPLVAIWVGLIIIGAGLYIASSRAGGYLTEKKYAETFDIDSTTYTYDGVANRGTFNFYSTDGVHFSFSSTDLLADVPSAPSKLDLYTCKYISGYNWCQLGSKAVVRYLLK